MGNIIDDFFASIIREINIFDRDGLYKDDEELEMIKTALDYYTYNYI